MADHADVVSLERVEQFLQETEAYRSQLLRELENVALELHRLTQWLKVDVCVYWSDELVKSRRKLTECQDALVRCQSYVRVDEKRPCTEEKKRLRKAQQRRETCEKMLRTTQAAAVFWEREQLKTRAKLQICRDMAESALLVACNQLSEQIQQLRTYTALKSPGLTSMANQSTAAAEADNQADAGPANAKTIEGGEA